MKFSRNQIRQFIIESMISEKEESSEKRNFWENYIAMNETQLNDAKKLAEEEGIAAAILLVIGYLPAKTTLSVGKILTSPERLKAVKQAYDKEGFDAALNKWLGYIKSDTGS
jgi:hypothetical protein